MARAKCPNKSHENYKLMVRLFGGQKALLLYDRNGEDIPTKRQIMEVFKDKTGDELSSYNNPEVWDIENAEDLVERWRTDENGKRVKVYKRFMPFKAKKIAASLEKKYPNAVFDIVDVYTSEKANTRVRVGTPFIVTEPEIGRFRELDVKSKQYQQLRSQIESSYEERAKEYDYINKQGELKVKKVLKDVVKQSKSPFFTKCSKSNT